MIYKIMLLETSRSHFIEELGFETPKGWKIVTSEDLLFGLYIPLNIAIQFCPFHNGEDTKVRVDDNNFM